VPPPYLTDAQTRLQASIGAWRFVRPDAAAVTLEA
jgi:hypothetical protein